MFGASIVYDNSQCTLTKKYERVNQLLNTLDKYHAESQNEQELERPRLILR